MITDTQLTQITPHLTPQKLALYLPHLNEAMAHSSIDNMVRTAAFIAQLAHESGEFRFMEEIWGPTDAQRRYEPPADLAKRLGNTQSGDGKRFKGRGPIQITGRFNYKKYGDLLGVDLVDHPELAADPQWAFATAGLFWKSNGLNELADKPDFVAITKRINGGTNGLADRQMYYERAKKVLGDNFIAADFSTPKAVPEAVKTRGVPRVAEPMERGHEAIAEDEGQHHRKPHP
jgi:putative chitinase